jgi:hypothetical protein
MCNGKKSCWNCKNVTISRGDNGTRWDPPTPDEFDCNADFTEKELEVMDIEDKWSEFDQDAEGCKNYEPQLYIQCRHCGILINKPKYNYPEELLVFGAFDDEPSAVCSPQCKRDFEDQENGMLEQQAQEEREAEEYFRNMRYGRV